MKHSKKLVLDFEEWGRGRGGGGGERRIECDATCVSAGLSGCIKIQAGIKSHGGLHILHVDGVVIRLAATSCSH